MSMYDDTVDVTPEGVSEGAALSGMFGESAPVETERGIETITEEIIFYKNVGGQAVIEIGRRLTEAKAQLKHGEWLPWLREKVEFSETSAQNFMRIAREYGNTHLVGDLGASKALVLLALPASERENFASEKHLVNGEEKSVSEMSKRELEEAIRQRKLAELERDKMQRELDEQRKANEEAAAEMQKAQEAAEAQRDEARKAVENAEAGKKAAEEQATALRAELEKARKSAAAMDNKALAEFGVLFRQAQETVNRMTELAGELDEENRPKVYRALGALRNMIAEKAGEATA